MKHYTQLTREERYQISALKAAGHNQVGRGFKLEFWGTPYLTAKSAQTLSPID